MERNQQAVKSGKNTKKNDQAPGSALSADAALKICTLSDLQSLLTIERLHDRKIVLCHGVFDLVHLGHVRHINAAKNFGDILVVTITADKYVKKGPGRPIFNQNLRAEMLANLEAVDYVAIVDSPTALDAISAVKPTYYVKGQDYREREKDVTGKIYDEEEAVKAFGGQIRFTDEVTLSSSQLINLYFESYPPQTLEYLRSINAKYSLDQIATMLDALKEMRILVIGDAIIDQYHYCSPLGKSSKENIVVNKYNSAENFAGGALAVANHVAQLSDNVQLLTVLGENESYKSFANEKLDPKIDVSYVMRPGCVTTVKRRYIAGDTNKKLFEVCYLDDHDLAKREEERVEDLLSDKIKGCDLVIVSDFGHGMLTPRIMNSLCKQKKPLALNVQTNGANRGFNLVTKYKRADFVCIDEQELRLATHSRNGDMQLLAQQVCSDLGAQQLMATRGNEGSLCYRPKGGFHEAPAVGYTRVDAVGAGDAFYSFTAPCFAAGYAADFISFLGNAVGSLAIQIVCNREPVKKVDLLKFMTRLLKV